MTEDFEPIARVVSDSVQARLLRGASRMARQAWAHSRLRSTIEKTRRNFGERPITERVRFVAGAVAIAALVNISTRAIIPPYAAPQLPIGVLLTVAIVAGAWAAAPAAFVTAWRASRFSRSKQR
jgi:hypothetical protein